MNVIFSFCMEDDYFLDIIPLQDKSMTIVTSGGDLALYALTKGLKSISLIDINEAQNELFKKKLACILKHDADEIHKLYGIVKDQHSKTKLNGLLYTGTMHKNFTRVSKVLKILFGSKIEVLIKNKDIDYQKELFKKLPLSLLLNKFVFKNVIYKLLKFRLGLNGVYRKVKNFDKFRVGLKDYLGKYTFNQNIFLVYLLNGCFITSNKPRYLMSENIKKIKSSKTEVSVEEADIKHFTEIKSDILYLSNILDLFDDTDIKKVASILDASKNLKLLLYPSVHFNINILDYGLTNFVRDFELEKLIDTSPNNFYPNSYFVFRRVN